ncbi:hypothetical protein AVEN_18623-1 [Araneus ventricosus]|uniref:Uncharacterized protein n=1 Tax=Araneus ventricosus TaxID=182803 RepID=A0A4Y2VF94_ARAVE|nr:hypothetical protein AVEN_18623-1 [Araneus ventricosus]
MYISQYPPPDIGNSFCLVVRIFGSEPKGPRFYPTAKSLPQICHDKSAGLQQVNESFEVTMGQTCIANYGKNRVRTQPGIELATYRLVTRGLNHSTRSATRGEDKFR